MTSPTTPRDAIGLSERLRDPEFFARTGTREELAEAASALDALQARVKELEAGWHDCITELTAEKKRVQELEAEQAAIVRDYQRMNSQLADEMKRAAGAEQERDKAYERAAKVAERHIIKPLGIETAKEASMSDTARSIAAAIRRLAAGTEKGKRE